MAYIVLPQTERTRSGLEEFSRGLQPGLETAMNLYLQNQFNAMQKRKAYEEAERLGLIAKEPYQEVPVQGGAAQIAPITGIKVPIQHKYKPTKGTTIEFEGGMPKFSYKAPSQEEVQKQQAMNLISQAITEEDIKSLPLDEFNRKMQEIYGSPSGGGLIPKPGISAQERIQALRGLGITPSTSGFTVKTPEKERPERVIDEEEYSISLNNAIDAIEQGGDPVEVFRRLASNYPSRSEELKRILLAAEKPTLEDLFGQLQSLKR